MSTAKNKRHFKRQMGQFLTPPRLACMLVEDIDFCREDKILEPSMGDGSFILPLISRFMKLYKGSVEENLAKILQNNIYGIELDDTLYEKCLSNIKDKWGCIPAKHNFVRGDFLLTDFRNENKQLISFDYVVGNPPFGGTIAPAHQDSLDKLLGVRGGLKIKKETYSFFIVKSMDLLRHGGRLIFICSDTFLTIATMQGLRNFLFYQAKVEVSNIPYFSDEVSQKTVLLKCDKGSQHPGVIVDGKLILEDSIKATPNHSWHIDEGLVKYFHGPKISDFMIATSGMTVGKNEYFIRKIIDGEIIEPYKFSFYQRPISLSNAVERARLGSITDSKRQKIMQQEDIGETFRDVLIEERSTPIKIKIPHEDYCYYNKSRKGIIYAEPGHVVFWRNNGDAVYTYKKNGNWYLNGVGGKKYFFREGLTWNLIASRLHLRYMPTGYVLDSGAPCAFLNADVEKDEMFFILGWGLTDLCNHILKKIINHTKNIQGKDFERLPYPFWVDADQKKIAIACVLDMIDYAKKCHTIILQDARIQRLNDIFSDESYFNRYHTTTASIKYSKPVQYVIYDNESKNYVVPA